MAVGIALLLFSIGLTLSEVTTSIARVRSIVFVVGIATLAVGAVIYGLARTTRL